MSALGQEQTCAAQKVMSTLPPKADICGAITNVRFANGGHLSGTDRRIDLDQEIARPIRVSEAAPKLPSEGSTFAQVEHVPTYSHSNRWV